MMADRDEAARVRLAGGLERTATTVAARVGGGLEVEFYDLGDTARALLGSDVSIRLTIGPAGARRMRALLCPANPDGEPDGTTARLLASIAGRFGDYFELRDWLDESRIPYSKAAESPA